MNWWITEQLSRPLVWVCISLLLYVLLALGCSQVFS